MAHTRAADDFRAIRARMEELRRERERADDVETNRFFKIGGIAAFSGPPSG
jgi:hypothetical protein